MLESGKRWNVGSASAGCWIGADVGWWDRLDVGQREKEKSWIADVLKQGKLDVVG